MSSKVHTEEFKRRRTFGGEVRDEMEVDLRLWEVTNALNLRVREGGGGGLIAVGGKNDNQGGGGGA